MPDKAYSSTLQWIENQDQRLRRLLAEWSEINTGTLNVEGIRRFSREVETELLRLGAQVTRHPVQPYQTIGVDGKQSSAPLAEVLSAVKRPQAPVKVLLGIHLDTVYPADGSFQKTQLLDADTLRGPGVADAKGGLIVLLTALGALEQSPFAEKIGWEVLLNPDEEIGSPGSESMLVQAASRNHFGLIFEPCFADGALAGRRKGSGNFVLILHGRSAHAGRDFQQGRNAIHAAGDFVVQLNALNGRYGDATFNVGRIDGGGPSNVVPDLAICRFNVRLSRTEDVTPIETELRRIAEDVARRHETGIEWFGGFTALPKELSEPTLALLMQLQDCGRELGLPISWRSSGGVSDGNRLAAAGLPNVDSLGVRGGNLHSPEEYCCLSSLVERSKLAALLLMKLGSGEIEGAQLARP